MMKWSFSSKINTGRCRKVSELSIDEWACDEGMREGQGERGGGTGTGESWGEVGKR